MNKTIKPQSLIFLSSLAAIGSLLIVVSALLAVVNQAFLSNLSATLGASILGAASSLLLARYFEPSQVDQLFQLIAESSHCSLSRDDRKVAPFLQKYYGYLRSHTPDGEPIWRFRLFDFSQSHTPGYLHAVVQTIIPQGTAKTFSYDGFIGGEHLILVGHAIAGSEPYIIHVFPNGCIMDANIIVGLAFVRSFDGAHLVAPSILSTHPLTGQDAVGPVSQAEQESLTTQWEKLFLGNHNLVNFGLKTS